ncbi:hypothetical protein M3614_22610, partial [Bacillus velezensis]|uniref:hypothetical protein n=1 Tax=Bacillus velezensis TaxID=492670 RepID=UPI00203DE854
ARQVIRRASVTAPMTFPWSSFCMLVVIPVRAIWQPPLTEKPHQNGPTDALDKVMRKTAPFNRTHAD